MQVRPTQSLRLGELQRPIERYLAATVLAGKVQMGPLLKRWILIGLEADVLELTPAKRKWIGQLPTQEPR